MCASADSSRIRSIPLFARPRFAFIIGWASFCKYGCEPPGLWIRRSLQSCWRIFTEEGYGIMPARDLNGTFPGFSIQKDSSSEVSHGENPWKSIRCGSPDPLFHGGTERHCSHRAAPAGVGPRSLLLWPQLGPGEDNGIFGAIHAPL